MSDVEDEVVVVDDERSLVSVSWALFIILRSSQQVSKNTSALVSPASSYS